MQPALPSRGEPARLAPADDPWTVAVHSATDDRRPVGVGVLIDRTRVLTCAHVVDPAQAPPPLFVTFPKAQTMRRHRHQVREVRANRTADVAVLELAEAAPAGISPALLRCPDPAYLRGERWWAFGFTAESEHGAEAFGSIGGALAWGWVSLHTESRYGVKRGFSGAGLWSPSFQAVIGLVGQAGVGGEHSGDGQALTLHQVVEELPDERLDTLTGWSLPAAGEPALAAWGWSLETDGEARQHWRPRARGVAVESQSGYRFSGRRAALTEIVAWLDRPTPDRRILVVTGSPGVGKSAVLGRIVTTADAGVRAALPVPDDNVKAGLGTVACAIHAKGKTALDVATELAKAASVRLPRDVKDLVPALQAELKRRGGRRFNIVLDALDEARSPAEARLIVSAILLPIAQNCSAVGAQVVVGTRRYDDRGDLVGAFRPAGFMLDLDAAAYFAEDDLAAYALATLRLVGDERPDNPYEDPSVGLPVARRIAALAERNFLIAGLVAYTHGMYDQTPVDPRRLVFTPTVDAALADYLERLSPVGAIPARLVLLALAYAQGLGFSIEVWRVVSHALSVRVEDDEVLAFTMSAAANFLVETSNEAGTRRFRLFHQALNDALLRDHEERGLRRAAEHALTWALIRHGRDVGWHRADRYLLQTLPEHADRAGLIDELLTDDQYLLYADLQRLSRLAHRALTQDGEARARLLHLTPQAMRAGPVDRAALFDLTQTMERLGRSFAPERPAAYRALWARVSQRTDRIALEGHSGQVNAVCSVVVDRQVLLASVSDDTTVRLWDPAIGSQEHVLRDHKRPVRAVCAVEVGGVSLLASAGDDGVVYLWDPSTGRREDALDASGYRIFALCGIPAAERTLLAAGCADGTVLLWNVATGGRERVLPAHREQVTSLCVVPEAHGLLLASGSNDGWVRLWDLDDGAVVHTIEPTGTGLPEVPVRCVLFLPDDQVLVTGWADGTIAVTAVGARRTEYVIGGRMEGLAALCPVVVTRASGLTALPATLPRTLLAAASRSGLVRLLDPAGQRQVGRFATHRARILAMCPVVLGPRTYLASANDDRTVRLWDPVTGRPERSLADQTIHALSLANARDQDLCAGIARDTVRLWDVSSGDEARKLDGQGNELSGLCAIATHQTRCLASGERNGTVRLWNLGTRRQEQLWRANGRSVNAVCAVAVGDRSLLASATDDGTVLLWDPDRPWSRVVLDSLRRRTGGGLVGHRASVTAICPITVAGQAWLASASVDNTLRLWNCVDRVQVREIRLTRTHIVTALCEVRLDHRTLLASASKDHTIALWDPVTGEHEGTLSGHTDVVTAICPVTVRDRAFLASASTDRTVRVWNVLTQSVALSIPVHHPALSCVERSDVLFVGLTAGIMAIRLVDATSIVDG